MPGQHGPGLGQDRGDGGRHGGGNLRVSVTVGADGQPLKMIGGASMVCTSSMTSWSDRVIWPVARTRLGTGVHSLQWVFWPGRCSSTDHGATGEVILASPFLGTVEQ